ncbi:MAG: acyl-CoA dehydrogenase family protein [Thermomicrobiales bacterium]
MPIALFYDASHEAFREQLRRFVRKEIEPYVDSWDEAGTFPRELYRKASAVGLLQANFPEELDGVPGDRFYSIIVNQELAQCGAGGICAGLLSHTLALPPIVRFGSDELRNSIVPAVLSGDRIAALAVTEPTGGSDVAKLRTTARREGQGFILNGEKTFITTGMRADYITVAVRTGGPGFGGLSLVVVDADSPGLSRVPLDRKMGWWASDTAALYFQDCYVPSDRLIGEENSGAKYLLATFNEERLGLAASAIGFSQLAYDEALAYAKTRETFGKRLVQHQVIRHKLVDMKQRIVATQALLEIVAWQMEQNIEAIAELCMLKNQATQTMAFCASEAVQIFGGAGFLRGSKVERIYREVKVNAIGGGTEEIMKELASRQLGF